MPANTFTRNERLKRKKRIKELFDSGHSFGMYPLRAVWKAVEQNPSNCPAQMAVSVPKKRFPSAVARNRIRRQVREAYRLHKQLLDPSNPPAALMILYTGQEALPWTDIEPAMIRLLKKLNKILAQTTPQPTPPAE